MSAHGRCSGRAALLLLVLQLGLSAARTPQTEAEASSEGAGGSGLQLYFASSTVYRQDTYPSVTDLPLHLVQLPKGFFIALYANQTVPAARSLALSGASNSTATIVYVGSDETGENGNVHALVDHGSDGHVDQVCKLLTNQDTPNGVAWHNGSLYVMETTTLTRYDNIDAAVLNGCNIKQAKATVLARNFPQQQDHAARYIAVGPDSKMYIGVGAPLNIVQCGSVNGVQQCSIMRMNLDGSGLEVFAYGVRNTVGFDWHPVTGDLYFGFLERDWQGAPNSTTTGYSPESNDRPDDYLCAAPVPGLVFGYPYCHWVGEGRPELRNPGPGYAIADSTLIAPAAEPLVASRSAADGAVNASLALWCEETASPPLQALGPHVAPLGVKFYNIPASGSSAGAIPLASAFPERYRNGGVVFVAQHGSWNRQHAIGYRVALVEVAPDGQPLEHSVFASGWLQHEGTPRQAYWGRPSGLLVLPDGSLLVSDDAADAVYRISHR